MVDEKSNLEILHTKLHRPSINRDHVHRPRLLEVLNNAGSRPLTLVAAPAGYGKSTLISCWLESCAWPSAWVSLDESDSDLRQFLNYFLSAIETIAPNALGKSLTLLRAPLLPPLSTILTEVTNELDQIDQDFFLALDDFHRIKDKSVHQLISDLLHHPPRSMHLVIISRHYPLMPLANFRAKNQLLEISTQDLCFTDEETRFFLRGIFGVEIGEATAKLWTEKTEGWVTALRLGTIAIKSKDNLNSTFTKLEGTSINLMEYFVTEVLSQQPQHVKNCLMELSILDRFCAPLCEAVCSLKNNGVRNEEMLNGEDLIDYLLNANLFLIPLDSKNSWFRIHHLLQQLMQDQLKSNRSPSKIKKLHSLASKWYGTNGFLEEAIQHALAAGDVPTAIQLVARHGHQLMNDQQWSRLERWLDMLPRDSVEEDPEMLLFSLWSNHMRTAGFDVSALATQLDKIENLISTLPPKNSVKLEEIRSHCDALRSFQYFIRAEGEIALNYARSACENLPIHHKRARLRAHIFQVGSYQLVGDLKTGLSLYYNEVQENSNLSGGDQAMYLANLCFVYWIDADLISMLQTSENTLKIAMDQRIPEAIAFSLYFNGIACYHQNNLQSAEEKLARMVKDFYMYMQLVHTHGSFCLSLIYQAQGQPDKARERNRKMMDYAMSTGNQMMFRTTQAFEAELALRQGRLSEASTWAERFNPKPFLPPFAFYTPQLTLVKILLAQDTTESRRRAADLLDELNKFLVSIHYNQPLIDVLLLQALLYGTLGDRPVALEKVAKALALAEPGGFIRPFVDLGPQMSELLKKLARKNIFTGSIGKILAAFKEDAQRAILDESPHSTAHPPPLSTQPIDKTLTNREEEILLLLAQRLQNKEIAEQLYISPQTVKVHLKNIYKKLNATDRRHVLSIARNMGIL